MGATRAGRGTEKRPAAGPLLLLLAGLWLASPTAVAAAFATPRFRTVRHGTAAVRSTSSASNDATFSAFADSLEDDFDGGDARPVGSSAQLPTDRSWQSKLDRVLNPNTSAADRQILVSDLLGADREIRQSVMDAVSRRQLDPILTPTGKRLQDGTRAVARQLANDILPGLSKNRPQPGSLPVPPLAPPSLDKVGTRMLNAFSNQLQKNLQYLREDLQDPFNSIPKRISDQTETIAQEAKNVFLETPEGLNEPTYTVVSVHEGYEIRDYDAYSVAETAMEKTDDLASSGKAFNSLAAYLFGANEDQRSMEMTTPVTTTSTGEMRFYLAENNVPEPLDKSKVPIDSESGSIRIIEIPATRLAVRKFTGFVTDGEVARQKETLLQFLQMDGVELDVPHGSIVPHVIFQYNPPYTLPIVRRNEIAVPVRGRVGEMEVSNDIRDQWDIPAAADAETTTTTTTSTDTEASASASSPKTA